MALKNKDNLKKYILPSVGILLIAALLIFDGVKRLDEKETEKSDVLMGTVVTQKLYGKGAEVTSAELTKALQNLENNILSWRVDSSDIAKINKAGKTEVSKETAEYIQKALDVSKKSNGALDITVGELSQLWDIGGQNAKVPSPDEINSVLKNLDYKKVSVENNTVKIGNGQKLDLGALGKGIACDSAKDILNNSKLSGAVVSVGGSILLWGDKPGGGDWRVAVRDPRGEQSDSTGVLSLSGGCVSTSGDYERVLESDGKKYHHILDPKTGYPADSGLMSVTIVSDSGLLSDALSTACFVLGKDEGMKLLKGFNAEGIFITTDKKVFVSDGLKNKFEIKNPDYTAVK